MKKSRPAILVRWHRYALALSVATLVAASVPADPVQADSGWVQTYYSDTTLATVCGTRTESQNYFFKDTEGDWTTPAGCPDTQAEWSVRMDRSGVYFQGGAYEFGLFYYGNARLYVDGQLVVDGWSATQHYEWRTLSAGFHTLRLEYKNNGGRAVAQMWWRGPGAIPYNNQNQDPNQWRVNYWGNPTQWHDSVISRNEGAGFINRDFGAAGPGYGIPSDHYSLRFERSISFVCGLQRFHVSSDDGFRLHIDGNLVRDRFTASTWDEVIDVQLTAGAHYIQLDYFESAGNSRLSLNWSLQTPCPSAPTPLTIQKKASQENVAPGQTVQFTLNVTASLTGTVYLTDTLPSGLQFESGSGSPGMTYDSARHAMLFSSAALPGQTFNLSYGARVKPDVLPGSLLPTRAQVSLHSDAAEALLTLSVPAQSFDGTLFLIYAAGDNDLSPSMYTLLNNAERAANNPNALTLMMLDGHGAQNARVYRLKPDDNPACPSDQNALCQDRYVEGQDVFSWTEDTATLSSLAEFINGSLIAYPNASRVVLSVVGHGEGWAPDLLLGQPVQGGEGGKPGGLLEDLNPKRSIATRILAEAVERGLQGTGKTRIDLLFLDSCLMATIETLYEFRNVVTFALASQSWSWTAFPYDDYLRDIDANHTTRQIGELWVDRAASSAAEYQLPYTYSLVDLTRLDALAVSVDQLSLELSSTLPTQRSVIASSIQASDKFDSSQDGLLGSEDEMRDLADLARSFKTHFPNSAISQKANAVINAVGDAVIKKSYAAGIPTRYSSQLWSWSDPGGISLFAPSETDVWQRRYYTPTQLALAASTHWDEFIHAFWSGAPPPSVPDCDSLPVEQCLSPAPYAIPQIALDAKGGRASTLLRWRVTGTLSGFSRFDVERALSSSTAFTVLTSNATTQFADRRPATQTTPIDYCYRIVAVLASGARVAASNIACASLGKLGLWVPHQAAPPNANEIVVPVNLENGDGLCASALSIVIRYDASIAIPTGSITPTIYSAGYDFKVGTSIPGEARVTHLGNCEQLFGSGTLFTLGFRTLNQEGQVSPLDFITSLGNTEVIDQKDVSRSVLLRTQNGSLLIKNNFLRADVNGDGFITIKDANDALQIASGAVTPLPEQRVACEVTGDGRCTAADASVIACYIRERSWQRCSLPNSAKRTRADQKIAAVPVIKVCLNQSSPTSEGIRAVSMDIRNAQDFASADLSLLFDANTIEYLGSESGESNLTVTAHHSRPGVLRVSFSRADANAPDFRAVILRFKSQTASGDLARVVSAAFADIYGRDAVESALQRQIQTSVCSASGGSVYLPLVRR